jgi:Domain of unknown function (DUF4382)
MKRHTVLGVLAVLALLVPLAALFLSCGGGGGSSSGGGTSSETSGTGSVAVLLADGPVDDYTNIWITIDKIYLLPTQGSPVVIFDGPPVTYDLLELRDGVALINQKSDVPPGRYEKIRLVVSKIDPQGGDCGSADVKLPSGKIDLNPREPLIVEAGRTVYVHLDFDAEKSINLHKAGKSGKCIFRPVVFVDVKYGEPPRPCPQLFAGTAESLHLDGDGKVDGFILSLCNEPNRFENRGDLTVSFAGDVRLFGANGDPLTDPSSLLGTFVTVVGRLSEGKILASVVTIGGVNMVKGTVAGAVGSDFVFPLTPDPRSGMSGSVPVHLILDLPNQVETLILLGCDKPVGYERIIPGMTARVAYKFVCGAGGSCVVRAVAVFLEPPMVSGTIQSKVPVDDTGYDLTILQDDQTQKVVFVPKGTPIHLASGVSLGIELLCPGQRVSVLLNPDKLPDLEASEIVVDLIKGQGRVQSINNQVLTLAWIPTP